MGWVRTLVPVLEEERPSTRVDGGCDGLWLDHELICVLLLDERHDAALIPALDMYSWALECCAVLMRQL